MLQKTVEAYKIWHAHHKNFPRLSRFYLDEKIDALFNDLVEMLLLAGYAGVDQKYSFLVRTATQLDLLKFFLQVT